MWGVNARTVCDGSLPSEDAAQARVCPRLSAKKWLMLFGCLLVAMGCNGRKAARGSGRPLAAMAGQPPTASLLLEANPARIEMGEVAQGGRKEARFTLTNSGTRAIVLSRIETSCDCLSVDVPLRVEPGEQVVGRVKLDLRDEPNFTGDLGIEIRGWNEASEKAFLVIAGVHVPHES